MSRHDNMTINPMRITNKAAISMPLMPIIPLAIFTTANAITPINAITHKVKLKRLKNFIIVPPCYLVLVTVIVLCVLSDFVENLISQAKPYCEH